MKAELKVGDKVCFRNIDGHQSKDGFYRILEIETVEPARDQKITVKKVKNNLYGGESEHLLLPQVSYLIEPLNGGEKVKAEQGEIDLVNSSSSQAEQ